MCVFLHCGVSDPCAVAHALPPPGGGLPRSASLSRTTGGRASLAFPGHGLGRARGQVLPCASGVDPSDWSTPRSRGSLAVVPRGYGHVAASSSSTTRSSVRNVAPQTPQTPSGMKRSAQCSQTRQAHAAVAVATRNCLKLPAAAGMACCSGGREASAVVSEQAQGAVSVTFQHRPHVCGGRLAERDSRATGTTPWPGTGMLLRVLSLKPFG